jgi:hypothetical protein
MDLTMHSFFAEGTRSGRRAGFDIYREIDEVMRDKIASLKEQKIAISFTKDKIFIALYKKSNPLDVALFQTFDLQKAISYDHAIDEIERIVDDFSSK